VTPRLAVRDIGETCALAATISTPLAAPMVAWIWLLVRNGETTVVQVKHWRRDVVGVSLVRELYGVQSASAATSAIFVTIGRFTSGAIAFADQVGLTLVDGPELLRIIGAGLAGMPFEVPLPIDTAVPTCPACGADMVQRTAYCGAHSGELFWDAPRFRPAGQRANSMPNPSAPQPRRPGQERRVCRA
jgi:hypothetical protein